MIPNNNNNNYNRQFDSNQQQYQIPSQVGAGASQNPNINRNPFDIGMYQKNLKSGMSGMANTKTLNSNSTVFIPSHHPSNNPMMPQMMPSTTHPYNIQNLMPVYKTQKPTNAPETLPGVNYTYTGTPPPVQSINEYPPMMTSQTFDESDKELEKIVMHIINLRNPDKREEALHELSKKRESFNNLAPILWHSIGTLAILLQEIVSIYQHLSPPQLTQNLSNRVCNVLGLLQCLALHPDTRSLFLTAHIPLFLYPFLNTANRNKPFENLRVTSLGVIGALVKGDDSDAIHFLMQTEIIPLCLRIMKRGQELSRTVATFIVQKILLDDSGLSYICQTAERFFAVSTVLQSMVEDLVTNQKEDQRLLRHIVRCYSRLSENGKSNEALKKCLPDVLKDPHQKFITDESVRRWHTTLLNNLGITTPTLFQNQYPTKTPDN